MHSRLVREVRSDVGTALFATEVLLSAVVLVSVGLTLVSPLVPTIPLSDIGFSAAAATILILTGTSLFAASRRIVRFLTGRGGVEMESFWRMLELMLAFFVAGIVAFTFRLGEFSVTVPHRTGNEVFVGLFFAYVLAGVGLAVIVFLRATWRVVEAEIQSALDSA
ncbi:hypothetical protein C453_08543 [Haloferax elongans ATCC BAA-1513]|uniref:Uncharacterized protein n=1 Tax=Haloferax elongans ATCC BAA-1513 TaxID=1230453 RepID=M0HMN3_HALEO|nr:hypothetical protein [Haloferax elongans]ELZ85850.1 hypothetical protein C453_08543 [Haloferax elongans ATCC BAA-1513]